MKTEAAGDVDGRRWRCLSGQVYFIRTNLGGGDGADEEADEELNDDSDGGDTLQVACTTTGYIHISTKLKLEISTS
jgi:hypothetical protein